MLREIKSPQRLPRQIHFHIDGTGTESLVIGSKDGVLVKNGTGDYTVALNKPFARAAIAVASPITAESLVEIASASASAINILCKTRAAGTAVDSDLYLIVQGFDAADEY
jgi:hypothetical protein